MLARRSYKPAYSTEKARAELRRCTGTQFDPRVVEALLASLDHPPADDGEPDNDVKFGMLPGISRLSAQSM